MGTQIQACELSAQDFSGFEGCNEILNVTKPDVIQNIHKNYLEAGADIIETNTFGALPWVLEEYGIGHRLEEITQAAAENARKVADSFGAFVFGAIGPGTKLVTLNQISFDEMEDGYFRAFRSLLAGGVDALLIETCQDLLQTKAAVVGALRAMKQTGIHAPLFVQVTIEQNGTMLLGTEIGAAINFLEAFPEVTGIGINCATGPEHMQPHVRFLSQFCTRFISVQPNAGLPIVENNRSVYPLSPEELSEYHRRFVAELGVDIVGGCCGTTPEHIRAVAKEVKILTKAKRKPQKLVGCSSLYQFQPYDQSPSFLIVGERTNANGSKAFREALAQENFDELVSIAREQENEGAHVLDVCVAYVGRDEVEDMRRLLQRYTTQVTIPLMIDTTEFPVAETACKLIPGKAIINSIHFEDGGKRLNETLSLCRKYGTAVVGLTIDEEGMAKTREKKIAVAERILQQTRAYGLQDEDVFIDCLTFTLGSGDEEFRNAGVETLEAIRELKSRHPRVNTILGISNISFGLKPAARHVLNSVFLHYAIEAGLTSAIVHAGKILPQNRVPPEIWESARKLVFNERTSDFDPLSDFMSRFETLQTSSPIGEELELLPVEERLKRHIIDGNKKNLEKNLKEALEKYEPLKIINEILLDGMKTVGELFGEGKMQLPFVLQSAEVMKAAVSFLEPYMEKVQGIEKGSILLATVAGDVHDIGKNLVDIILSNNGYRVVNIGIKQPINNILSEAETNNVQVIGMSGLLVKSTLVMRDNLLEMNARGVHRYPVILGGAALTRAYVERDLRSLYKGDVYYAQDAFEGLRLMETLTQKEHASTCEKTKLREETPFVRVTSHRLPDTDPELYEFQGEKSDIRPVSDPPVPPFTGSRVVTNIDIFDVFPFINEVALFRGQWSFRRPKEMDNIEFHRYLEEQAKPHFERLKREFAHVFEPKVVYGYFPAKSCGNEIIIYDENLAEERARFRFPRQKTERRLCIADFVAPVESNVMDYVAFHLVTVGPEITRIEKELFAKGDYREYLFVHGLGVETAEALAEYWHKRIREEWGIADEDPKDMKLIFSAKYRGCRYSFGYPACPNLEDQKLLFELLEPERIGVELTEEFMLVPEQSTSAIILHHPEAKYFNIR